MNTPKLRNFGPALLLALAILLPVRAQFDWGPSGLGGSGLQNCVAIRPDGSGLCVSGGDVSGLQRSTDYGAHWYTCNIISGSLPGLPPKIAAVAFSKSTSNTVYAGFGDGGGAGGFLVSTDAGQTWNIQSATPVFNGNGASPDTYPRSTGNLIAVDDANGYLYAGTFQGGLMRSTNGGSTWQLAGLAGKYIRSVALDPANPSSLYVAVTGGYVWHCSTARSTINTGTGTTGWTQLNGANAPATVEEMIILGSTLYAVGENSGNGGAWKYNISASTWTKFTDTHIDTGAQWTAIAGYTSGGSDILFIGATHVVVNGDNILESTNSGSTWTPVTQSANIVNQIGGAGGPPWWEGLAGGDGSYMLGQSHADVENLQIDPTSPGHVLEGGHGGVWATSNGTAAAGSILWYPMMNGLNVCVAESAAVDPNNPGRVYIGDEDHTFFWSTDYGATYRAYHPALGGTTAFEVAVDPINGKVYLGNVDTSAQTGELVSNVDPTAMSGGSYVNAWVSEGLQAVCNHATQGVSVGRDSGGGVIVLAAVHSTDSQAGIWRKSGSNWTQVATGPNPQAWTAVDFSWKSGSKYVFCYERSTGLWRSSDYGQTWSNIWATTGGGSGRMAGDPAVADTVYVATGSGVFRLAGASGTPTVTQMDSGATDSPGPVAVDSSSHLYVCSKIMTGLNAAMYEWLTPATSTAYSVISDSVLYPGQCGWPSGLAVDTAGIIHVAAVGDGSMDGAQSAPAAPTGLIATPGNAQVSLTWTGSTGATSYHVKRATVSGGPYTTIASPTGTSDLDTGVTNGTTYYYVVSAVSGGGESPNSSQASATPTGLPSGWTDQDIGSVGFPGSGNYTAGTYTVTGSGANIYGTADSFNFVYQTWTGDAELVARVPSISSGSNALAKAGLMIRQSLAANSPMAITDVTPSSGVEFIRRYTAGGSATNTPIAGPTPPVWLKLVRTGDVIAAYSSSDGVSWVLSGSDTVVLGAPVYVGLAVCARDNTQSTTATFDNVATNSPWVSGDVGSVGVAGSYTVNTSTGVFTIEGSGANVYSTADSFYYVFQPLYGNGQILAKVNSVQNTDPNAKAGVMIRQDLTAGSVHATVDLTSANGVEFLRRTTAGSTTTNTVTGGLSAPYWVKLVRSGSTFTASSSPDGSSWTTITTATITMANPVYIGLLVCAHNNTVLNTSVLQSVAITPTP